MLLPLCYNAIREKRKETHMKQVVYNRKPLGNSRFQWKQRDFALSTFNCIGRDMDLTVRNCVEAGFNLLEVGWGTHEEVWEAVEMCEKHGIDLIFQDLKYFGGMMFRHDDRPVDDDIIRQTVEKLKGKKHTVGYYVWDEPFCDYLFAEARRQSDILHEYDPEALLFSVFPPSYNPGPTWDNGEYPGAFEEYIKRLEPPVLSMDAYPVGNYCRLYDGLVYTDEKQLDDSPMWLDLTLARNLARKYKLPLWFYYQACGVYKTEKLTFPMVRMMMYAGALYGAKGLQSYTLTGTCHCPKEGEDYPRNWTTLLATGEKGEFFEDHKKIHAEFKALGNTLMALDNRGVYHSDDLQVYGKYGEIYKGYADSISESEVLAGQLPGRTSVGEFSDGNGNVYLLVLNREFEKGLEAGIPLKGQYHIYEVSKADGKQRLTDTADALSISLAPGDAALFRVQEGGEEPFTVEYRLEAE